MRPARLRTEDFSKPEQAADAVNRVVDALAESRRREVRVIPLRVPENIDRAFPFLLETGDLQVGEVRVAKVENVTAPDGSWTGGVTVVWRRGPRSNIEIRHVSGLDANTTYRLTLILEDE